MSDSITEPEGFRNRVFNRNDLKLEDYYYLDKILKSGAPTPSPGVGEQARIAAKEVADDIAVKWFSDFTKLPIDGEAFRALVSRIASALER